jgi:hypothetical protein
MAQNSTIAYVTELPECYFCKNTGTQSEKDSPAKAEFDFRTKTGPWAFACMAHYEANRMYPTLGLGKGQRLEVRPIENPFRKEK